MQTGGFLVAVGQTELMTSFIRTERLSSGSERADMSCTRIRVTSETSTQWSRQFLQFWTTKDEIQWS